MEVKLLGKISEDVINEQLKICAAAGKLSRMKGNVQDALDSFKTPEEALKFINRVIKMGHTATIDHDYLVFALTDVTPALEQTIIAERFSSFTIKSRREVDFRLPEFYTPDFHDEKGNILKDNDILKEKYQKHMHYLFETYSKFVDNNINKEDARFVLPYCYYSQIIMGLDATALARMILLMTKSFLSKITEFKEFGEKLQTIAEQRCPYLKTIITDKEYVLDDKIYPLLKAICEVRNYKPLKDVVLLDYTKNTDDVLIINSMARCYGYTFEEAKVIYQEKIKDDEKLKEKLIKEICQNDGHDDLKQVHFTFNITTPLAILTHYTRHRRLSLSIPRFVPNIDLTKYVIPESIKEKEELLNLYEDAFKENQKIYNEFKKQKIREEDLLYFSLSGNSVNILLSADGEALRWLCRLRMCTKAQWCIRGTVSKMQKEVSKIAKYYGKNLGPDCVTKHICTEGKESCGRINTILEKLGEENGKR